MAEAKIALHALTAGLVLDRSVFVGQTVAEMQSTLVAIRSAPKKSITVIENGATFFTAANMLDLIKADDDHYKLIAEKAKVTLRDEDVTAIKTAEAAKKAIEASMIPPIPPYPFRPVPEGFVASQKFELTNNNRSLRRVGAVAYEYRVSLAGAQKLWASLSKYWVKGQTVPSFYTNVGTERRIVQEGDTVRIGCQNVQRFEIEQIALWQGWAFPEVAKK